MAGLRHKLLLAGIMLAPLLGAGCLVPNQPWVTERFEDQYLHKNDYRTPIMPPIREGFPPPLCVDEPSEQEVLRAMPRVARGVPFYYEEFRDDIEIACEKLVDKIDPPRFFPVVGPAQLHHCHWKCTVYFTEITYVGWPVPYTTTDEEAIEVIYIDHNHFHMVGNVDPGADTQF